MATSEQRRAELLALRATDPAQIIYTYQGINNLPADGQLPYGVSFDAMIAAIVAHDEQSPVQEGEQP